MKRKSLWLLLSWLMVAALLMASCTPPEKEGAVPTEGKEPQYGGTLTVLTRWGGGEHLSFDAADMQWMHSYTAGPYQEGLLIGDLQKGPRGTNEWAFMSQALIPEEVTTGCLAESWEFTDPLTLVFRIRQGVMWQDKPGVMAARELTAEDIAFSWNRVLEASKTRPGYSFDFVDSFSAPDRYTVVVEMNEFNANWQCAIAWGYCCLIAPPELTEVGARDWKNACGTGPFMLTDYTRGSYTTYERNPNYWGKTTIGGKEYQLPFVDKMVWPLIVDPATRLASLRTGKVDIDAISSWEYVESLEETNPELQRWEILGGSVLAGMRTDTPFFDDIRVRRAMNMAIDKQAIIASLSGGHGHLLDYPFRSDWGDVYTPLDELPESCQELFTYNPEKARELLAEAGYPDGFSCEVVCPTLQADVTSMVAGFWEEIGVECEIKPLEFGALFGTLFGKTHKHIIFHFGGEGNNPLRDLWNTLVTGERYNSAMWSDPAFDEKWHQAATERDPARRNELLKELSVYAIENSLFIMLPTADYYRYAWPWVRNYWGESCAGAVNPAPIYARIWLDQELKEAMGY